MSDAVPAVDPLPELDARTAIEALATRPLVKAWSPQPKLDGNSVTARR